MKILTSEYSIYVIGGYISIRRESVREMAER